MKLAEARKNRSRIGSAFCCCTVSAVKRRAFEVDPEKGGLSLAAFLADALALEVEAARRLIEAGAAYVDGKRVRNADVKVVAGQKVLAVLEERGQTVLEAPLAPSSPVSVLFEDELLLAVDKPAGVTTQGTQMRETGSLLEIVSAQRGQPVWLVHRLDRDTSGVILFAKSRQRAAQLNDAFRNGEVRKRYLAVIPPGLPERGDIELPISRDPSRPGRMRATARAHGLPASTSFERLFANGAFACVALLPRTGRTHQLRAHLRALDAPIAGDTLYGGPKNLGGIEAPRCLLHARSIEVGGRRPIVAPLPGDLRRFFALAGLGDDSV